MEVEAGVAMLAEQEAPTADDASSLPPRLTWQVAESRSCSISSVSGQVAHVSKKGLLSFCAPRALGACSSTASNQQNSKYTFDSACPGRTSFR